MENKNHSRPKEKKKNIDDGSGVWKDSKYEMSESKSDVELATQNLISKLLAEDIEAEEKKQKPEQKQITRKPKVTRRRNSEVTEVISDTKIALFDLYEKVRDFTQHVANVKKEAGHLTSKSFNFVTKGTWFFGFGPSILRSIAGAIKNVKKSEYINNKNYSNTLVEEEQNLKEALEALNHFLVHALSTESIKQKPNLKLLAHLIEAGDTLLVNLIDLGYIRAIDTKALRVALTSGQAQLATSANVQNHSLTSGSEPPHKPTVSSSYNHIASDSKIAVSSSSSFSSSATPSLTSSQSTLSLSAGPNQRSAQKPSPFNLDWLISFGSGRKEAAQDEKNNQTKLSTSKNNSTGDNLTAGSTTNNSPNSNSRK